MAAQAARPDSGLAARLEVFLFAPADPRSAALFRMALGAALPIFFWSHGMGLYARLAGAPGLPWLYENIFLTLPYWLLALAVSAAFGLGWRPRLTGYALAALLLPLAALDEAQQSRQVLLFALLAFALVRSDAQWSARPGAGGAAGPLWPIRLVQLQLSVLYGVNALAKTTPAYLSGDVLVYMSRLLPNFLLDLTDGYYRAGPLAVPVGWLAVASVLAEYALALGFWFRRLRWPAAAAGALFHLTLTSVLTIHMLGWAALFLYLAFLLPFDRRQE